MADKSSNPFLILPEELILKVCRHLSTPSLAKFTQVCKTTARIATPELYRFKGAPVEFLETALKKAAPAGEATMLRLLKGSMDTLFLSELAQFKAFVYSIQHGYTGAVQFLLESKVDPDVDMDIVLRPDEFDGMSAAKEALIQGHDNILNMLVAYSADLSGFDFEDTQDFLTRAATDRECIARIAEPWGLNITRVDADGNTLLHEMINGSFEVPLLRLLLDQGLDLNATNLDGETVLYRAIKRFSNHEQWEDGVLSHIGGLNPGPAELEALRFFLENGADVNAPCENVTNRFPIHVACEYATAEVVRLLLDHGARVDPRSTMPVGQTALFQMSIRDNIATESPEILRMLLEAGLDLAEDEQSTSAFLDRAINDKWVASLQVLFHEYMHQLEKLPAACDDLVFTAAAVLGDVSIMQSMVLSGAVDVNNLNTPALVHACHRANFDAVEFLVNAGYADFMRTDNQDFTALHAAICAGEQASGIKIIRLLLPRTELNNGRNSDQETPLRDAVRLHDVSILALLVDRLLQAGRTRAQLEDDFSDTLMTALQSRKDDKVEFLVSTMQQHALTVCRPYAPINCALSHADAPHLAQMLLDATLAIDNSFASFTPLMGAIEHGHPDIASQLIAKGADLNVTSFNGATALMLASDAGYYDLVREMTTASREAPLDVNAATGAAHVRTHPERGNLAALDYAVRNGHAGISTLLSAAGATFHPRLLESAAALDHPGTLALFFIPSKCNNATAAITQNDLQTALTSAIRAQRIDNVRFLLAYGASVHAPDPAGRLALCTAARTGSIPIIQVLLNAGGAINAVKVQHEHEVGPGNEAEAHGRTPLMAAASKAHGFMTIPFLVRHGAAVNIWVRDGIAHAHADGEGEGEGMSALAYAVVSGHARNVQELIMYGADVGVRIQIGEQGQGRGLLQCAVRARNAEVVRMLALAAAGAGGLDGLVVERDGEGKTPLELCGEVEGVEGVEGEDEDEDEGEGEGESEKERDGENDGVIRALLCCHPASLEGIDLDPGSDSDVLMLHLERR
ncbi:ankyrin repeat-containing domain protein [Aspergillus multicolor]|uniref:ankyrin repeat-containing domain protein n=1 Tax=Aspergillus multicolor TaxID=41759 RepID=UPI003CCD4E23